MHRVLHLLAALSTTAGSTCPAGPFQLHNFTTPNVTNEPDRPYFIVLCDLATTVRLDPLMHPDAPQCHSHMHSVFGSNHFGSTVSLEDSMLGPNELANTTCHIPGTSAALHLTVDAESCKFANHFPNSKPWLGTHFN